MPSAASPPVSPAFFVIGAGKSNRRFSSDGQSHRLSTYGPNVLWRSGRLVKITGLKRKQAYCVAKRIGCLKKLDEVAPTY